MKFQFPENQNTNPGAYAQPYSICTWDEIPSSFHENFQKQIKHIFFLSSVRQLFSSEQEKVAFWNQWTSFYFQHYPNEFFFAVQNQQILAYLSACSDSLGAFTHLSKQHAYYELFKDLYQKYPAHLHINTDPSQRGRGLGSELINTYENYLIKKNVFGFHIVTSPQSKNVDFYTKLGFQSLCLRKFKGSELLFMGKIFANYGKK